MDSSYMAFVSRSKSAILVIASMHFRLTSPFNAISIQRLSNLLDLFSHVCNSGDRIFSKSIVLA